MTIHKSKFLSSLFLLLITLITLIFNPVKVLGQGTNQVPDIVVFVNVTLGGQTTVTVPATVVSGGVGDNRTVGAQTYTFTYQATGTGALTGVDFQAGKSATTTVTFADWAGTVSTGINPNTSSTGATSTFATGCASMSACTVANSWVQILITRGTFVGTINGVLYGYRTGYLGSGSGGGGGGSGCPGTVGTPCVVDGVTAAGSPPTTAPVLVAGQDGTNVQTVKTDTNGSLIPANAISADADGVSNTEFAPTGQSGGILYPRVFNRVYNGVNWDRMRGTVNGVFIQGPVGSANTALGNPVQGGGIFNTTQPTVTNGQMVSAQYTNRGAQIVATGVDNFTATPPGLATAQGDGNTNTPIIPVDVGASQLNYPNYPFVFNGATWDRQFGCTNQAVITLTAATDVVIVAGVSSTNTRICHVDFASDTTATFTIRQGTGTTCLTNTATLAGGYPSINTLAMDYQPTAALRSTIAARDICLHSSASATVGGVVIYAQY